MENDVKNESLQTYERGRSENLLQACKRVIIRHKHYSKDCRMKIWYKKRDSSWNACIVIPKGSPDERYLCPDGQGWDIVDAVENYRVNLLQYFDNELKPETSFINLYEIEQIFDREDGVVRNKVGAIVTSEDEPKTTIENLMSQIQEISLILKNIENGEQSK